MMIIIIIILVAVVRLLATGWLSPVANPHSRDVASHRPPFAQRQRCGPDPHKSGALLFLQLLCDMELSLQSCALSRRETAKTRTLLRRTDLVCFCDPTKDRNAVYRYFSRIISIYRWLFGSGSKTVAQWTQHDPAIWYPMPLARIHITHFFLLLHSFGSATPTKPQTWWNYTRSCFVFWVSGDQNLTCISDQIAVLCELSWRFWGIYIYMYIDAYVRMCKNI